VYLARLRTYFDELPRRVYLVMIVTGLFIVVAAFVGTLGTVVARSDSKAIQAMSQDRQLLEAVVSSTAQAQTNITALSQLSSLSDQEIASVTSLHQSMVDGWERFEEGAYGDRTPPPAAARVSAEIDQQRQLLQQEGAAGGALTEATVKADAAAGLKSLDRTASDLAILQNDEHLADEAALRNLAANRAHSLDGLLVAAGLALLTVVVGNTSIALGGRRFEKAAAARESDLDEAVQANEFEARLQRALDMSPNESRVYGVVGRAFNETVPDLGVELLQADSSRAHFEPLVTTGDM
jgi:DNA-binding transcriptional regulator YiaG